MPGAFSHACQVGPHSTQPLLFQEDNSGLSQVMEYLEQSTAGERTFHETYYSGMLTTPSHKEGTLVFHPPSRLEKHILSPAKESFIAEGETLHYENPSREISRTFALQDFPALAALIEGLRSLFNGDEPALRQFFSVSMAGTPDQWHIQLSPKTRDDDDGVDCIRLAGDQTHLRTIAIYEINGDRSELQLDP